MLIRISLVPGSGACCDVGAGFKEAFRFLDLVDELSWVGRERECVGEKLSFRRVRPLLLGADADILARLPEWLNRVQIPLPAEAEFFTEMVRLLDPVGSSLLEENLALRPGESVPSRVFTDYLWEMAPLASGPSLES